MKNYEIEIDEQVYHVKVRELPDDAVMPEQTQPDSGRHATESHPPAEGKTMLAPLAGTILRILVKEGQRVKKGENLIILEAMKMENEIVADKDGIIRSILVKANDSVESDQPLLIL